MEKRFEQFAYILNHWLLLRQRGKNLQLYFEDNQIQSIAIYGMGMLGERLYEELRDTPVRVAYAIDRMAKDKQYEGLHVFGLDETNYPVVDAVIVTPVQEYWEIAQNMGKKLDVPFLSLEDVVMYCVTKE